MIADGWRLFSVVENLLSILHVPNGNGNTVQNNQFTKRAFPNVAEFAWYAKQYFDAEITYAKDGENVMGKEWEGRGVSPALEERGNDAKVRGNKNAAKKGRS